MSKLWYSDSHPDTLCHRDGISVSIFHTRSVGLIKFGQVNHLYVVWKLRSLSW